jgi:pimeloyl-ACP methyl ester carboxylesterase
MTLAAVAALSLGLGGPAGASSAAKGKRQPLKISLKVAGGSRTELVCGASRRVSVVTAGSSVRVGVRVANRRAGKRRAAAARRRARRALLIVERCAGNRWVRSGRGVLGRAPRGRRAVRRYSASVGTPQAADLRVRAVVGRSGRRAAVSRPRYVRAVARVAEREMTFRVVNRNGSRVACQADGRTYDVRAHLVGPRDALDRDGGAATVYLHQIGMGGFYWHFKAVPGYDFATELARLGHVSVVVELIGYDGSGRPDGTQSCYGSEADTASQIAAKLRSGDYTSSGGSAQRFARVALGSNAAAGFMSQPAAYSFGNFDALVVTSLADQGFSQFLTVGAFDENAFCASGGQSKDGQPGYVNTPMDPALTGRLYFADANPRVVKAVTDMRAPGPCGEPESALATIAADHASLGEVKVPVLLVYGTKDAFFEDPRSAGTQQKDLYSGSSDVTLTFIEGAGNALALERSAPRFRDIVSRWLTARGL